jgi:stage IV sporulation protein FB
MDGGRVLRAVLAMKLHYVTATRIAARVGQAMAILFAVYALTHGLIILVLVALFVFFGADEEVRQAPLRAAFKGILVRDLMVTRFPTVSPNQEPADAVELLVDDSREDMLVTDGGRPVGLLAKQDLIQALAEEGGSGRIGDLMRKDVPVLEDREPLESAFQRMRETRFPTFAVVREGALVGVLPLAQLGREMLARMAKPREPSPPSGGGPATVEGARESPTSE